MCGDVCGDESDDGCDDDDVVGICGEDVCGDGVYGDVDDWCVCGIGVCVEWDECGEGYVWGVWVFVFGGMVRDLGGRVGGGV